MIEIERKFLIKTDAYKAVASSIEEMRQGFLSRHPERTVRIRVKGEIGSITIKGKSNRSGTSRFEWEKEIPLEEAKQLMTLCEEEIIHKTRYSVAVGEHIFEVDEFHGKNQGLVIAEVELKDENESFSKPAWLGKEVTGDNRYYNSQISRTPYNLWKPDSKEENG